MQVFNIIAFTASLLVYMAALVFILEFSYKLINSMDDKNLKTNLLFLGLNISLLVLLTATFEGVLK